ncbi:MAG: peptidylprolyl isomerase [Saprospirales bacterium]|nr:peptidylprolyl isomerase [Saprospirales bacterium]
MKLRSIVLFAFALLSFSAFAQSDDPILFTVDDTPVHVSEFKYIYTKTNGKEADFSEASLKEYLDLYINFKLKVQKAKELRLDTIKSLQQELAGYRRQLADSYLIDREVTEKLIQEAYERTQQDVDISHIMINLPPNASPEEDLQAQNRIKEAKERLEEGASFEQIAKEYSTDKSVSKNGGHIGWVTALFPNGFYNLETAAYTAPIGKVTGPIKTDAGYHLLLVHGRRPARGEIEVAHILIRNDKMPDTTEARKLIETIYEQLKAGANFEDLAKQYSHDQVTAPKGGYIGFFGINRYEQSFEDAAFALENDGDISKPVQTSIGWHIIKRISLKRGEELRRVKGILQNKVKNDARFELAKQAMIHRIKTEANFREDRTTLQHFVNTLMADSAETFLSYRWRAPEPPSTEILCQFGEDFKVSLGDFENYCQRASRKRQQLAARGILAVVEELYKDFTDEQALRYEERHLEEKYPEFKSLMREYEEGVLLFEVTKQEVWDKAAQDTTGLEAFFEKHKDNYKWDERAVVSQYSLSESTKELINQVREYARTHTPTEVLAKFNPEDGDQILSYQSRKYEKGRNETLNKMKWEVGSQSAVSINKRDRSYNWMKIEEILPPAPKSLQEARGYVVADYQDYLEKKWLESLKKEFKVKVNDVAFNSLVKK